MAIIRIRIDLAKNVFALHGVDESGRVQMVPYGPARAVARCSGCCAPLCGGHGGVLRAHDLARRVTALGHSARIMAAKFRLALSHER